MELSELSSSEFYQNINNNVPKPLVKKYLKKLNRGIKKDIPVQHLVGYSYFFGNKFLVNKNVLIPRNETEELVEHTLIFYDMYFSSLSKVKVLDLATGSGCIGITLAMEIPNAIVKASDISRKALNVARKNAYLNNASIDFIKSNWFENINGKFDIIIANPPYLTTDEEIGVTVDKEPKISLYGGDNGLMHYQTIIENIKPYLNERALVGFEHGIGHSNELRELILKYFPNANITQFNDLNNRPRFTFFGIGGILKWVKIL